MARIGNATQNNKIRLIAGNGSEMVLMFARICIIHWETLLAEQYLAFFMRVGLNE